MAPTLGFCIAERVAPGRPLPAAPGGAWRAALTNLVQLAPVGLGGLTWHRGFREAALLPWGGGSSPVVEGALYWFGGTFVFYWWHRPRHVDGFWQLFHQVHHSASRIGTVTAFDKHPLEIAADALIASFLIYAVCGGSAEAGAWASWFGTLATCFYHSNLRTPRWLGWFVQRPEHHSVHHASGVHAHNDGDITLWDRLFGTFRDADGFAPQCGFPPAQERQLAAMLRGGDVLAPPRARAPRAASGRLHWRRCRSTARPSRPSADGCSRWTAWRPTCRRRG